MQSYPLSKFIYFYHPQRNCPCTNHSPTPPLHIFWQPLIYLLSAWICLLLDISMNVIIQYVVFCDWHLSLYHSPPFCFISLFFLPNNILLYGFSIFHLSVQLIDIRVISTLGPLWLILWIFMYMFLYEQILLILLGLYLIVRLPDYKITPCLTFEKLPNWEVLC